jgi:hypothetical protein
LAKPRTPNEGSLHLAATTKNEGCPTFCAPRERCEGRTPRPTAWANSPPDNIGCPALLAFLARGRGLGPFATTTSTVTPPEDWTWSSARHNAAGEECGSGLESGWTARRKSAAWCVSGGPPALCQLKAPPSRQEREKGRAPSSVRGESMGQPPENTWGDNRVPGCPGFSVAEWLTPFHCRRY